MKESKQCLIVHNDICRECGYLSEYEYRDEYPCTVEVSRIVAKEDGWELEGIGSLDREHISCPECCDMHDGVANLIPIECHSYHCPKCDRPDSLEYKVKKIEASGYDFLFEAQINCKKCKKKGVVRSLLKNILDLVKIELGPTGITVKKS